MLVDPRLGDAEDDHAAPQAKSLLAISGRMVSEISPLKLMLALVFLFMLPAAVIGLAPLLLGAWFRTLADQLMFLTGASSVLVVLLMLAGTWLGFRPVWRLIESQFWSTQSLLAEPLHAVFRESLRHLGRKLGIEPKDQARLAQWRGWSAFASGALAAIVGAGLALVLWPETRWTGAPADLRAPLGLIPPALANAAFILCAVFAAASLAWGVRDGLMDQPRDAGPFAAPQAGVATWRIAHLSDVHCVGERFGFRIESGRKGPCGNDRFAAALATLAQIHREQPIDVLLISGDMTDAGRSTEWAEFLELLGRHPELAAITLILPGNHDLNVIDRANPARLDLPTSPGRRLREMRTLSAMHALQGSRTHIVDRAGKRLGMRLDEALEPHAAAIADFADRAGWRRGIRLWRLWSSVFPLILPPASPGGLGFALLNSNAPTHFSFTNALGLVPADDVNALCTILEAYPAACWIVALHHHLVEYPQATKKLSERLGTALINGSWLVRKLKPHAARILVMHGHRHIDWIGTCGRLRIVSAPSPVMSGGDAGTFLIHTVQAREGGLVLLPPLAVAPSVDRCHSPS